MGIIFDELVQGQRKSESLLYFQQAIEAFKTLGCDAVVLGCTELPLLVGDEVNTLPTLDSTRILARGGATPCLAMMPLHISRANSIRISDPR